MDLTYSIESKCEHRPISIKWFDEFCLSEHHEICTAIEECARDHYQKYDNNQQAWPLEITLHNNGKEIGSKKVVLEYEPTFECV